MDRQRRVMVKLLLTFLAMVILTALLLLIGAVLVYYVELSAQIAKLVITVVYILVGLSGGFMIGKLMKTRKFLWGIVIGLCYFVVLVLVSLGVNGAAAIDVIQMLITFVLLIASSMIGGMIS